MPCYEFEGIRPVVDSGAYVHPAAVLIGDVIVGPNCFVGPCAVMRGDLGRIVMQRGANLQDGCIVHSFPRKDVELNEHAHIGHGAILHGCVVRRNAMVGMNAVVMDGCEIGEDSFVAASAFVRSDMQVPARTLVAGVPAKIIRELREEEIHRKSRGTEVYEHLVQRYSQTAQEVKPLIEIEPGRRQVPDLSHLSGHDQPH